MTKINLAEIALIIFVDVFEQRFYRNTSRVCNLQERTIYFIM